MILKAVVLCNMFHRVFGLPCGVDNYFLKLNPRIVLKSK